MTEPAGVVTLLGAEVLGGGGNQRLPGTPDHHRCPTPVDIASELPATAPVRC